MKTNLIDKERKAFKIWHFFCIQNISPHHKNSLKETEQWGIPYLSRTASNNWLETIVVNNNYHIYNKNCITFWAESAEFFYQPFHFIAGNKMYYLTNKNKINNNKYILLFLVKCLKNSIFNCWFGYGQGLTGTRLKRRMMLLPVNTKNEPDWAFMESYMQELEQNILKNAISYYAKRISNKISLSLKPEK